MVYSRKLAEQYAALKADAGAACVLLMQVGSFMQVQGEDARAVSEVSGLKLQMAGDVDAPVVPGGFPKSGLDAYVGKLVRAGLSAAVRVAGRVLRVERRIRGLALSGLLDGHDSPSAGGALRAPAPGSRDRDAAWSFPEAAARSASRDGRAVGFDELIEPALPRTRRADGAGATVAGCRARCLDWGDGTTGECDCRARHGEPVGLQTDCGVRMKSWNGDNPKRRQKR